MAGLKKLLCPVDLAPSAVSAAHEAASLAKSLGAELVLLYVMADPALAVGDPLLAPGELSGYALPVLTEEYRSEMDRRLRELAEQLRKDGISVSTMLVRGSPHEAIVDTADSEHADMIVMTTHGRTGVPHFLLGSVTERVVRAARVPVLTLRASH
ncbi:MAG TPA: universal stress protein [Polyangiaceae bacterium]|nr:universal stress protein [Polyangiaceae bacterium]